MIRVEPGLAEPAKGSVFLDRPFGLRNIFDDPPNATRHYIFPAIEATKSGDVRLQVTTRGIVGR